MSSLLRNLFSKHPEVVSTVKSTARDTYIALCLTGQLLTLAYLFDRYLFRLVGVKGPSMLPTIGERNNLLLLDCFTYAFLRSPQKNDIVVAENPFKPGHTLVKRVLYVEGEMAEVMDQRSQAYVSVVVPKGHVWIEGDNKSNSRDSRDFGPISVNLVDGVVRARVWPWELRQRLD
ncbi:hypothetical protein FGO68_gene11137 [Halteria grandinella]|uniref:Peptidase S26 domain-containing protein n=1 Tax=Halteria grandinella TaxID=5974 RepID=A0A8J8NIZ0_HALGN|nr:hypothetical protein FGO68_gene11137 [Halteria grandinella]